MTRPIPRPLMLGDIMKTEVYTVTADTDILVATADLLERDISGAPVIDEKGHVVAVLSKRDCLKAALNAYYHQDWSGKVSDYMVQPVQTMDVNTEIAAAAVGFINSRYRRFPITNNGLLMGQVSRTDVLKALATHTLDTGDSQEY